MKIYIKDNEVFKNATPLNDIDFDLPDNNLLKKNIYIGENGVGKTFLLQVFTSIAFLRLNYDKDPLYEMDRQRVIQYLYDAGIGEMLEKGRPNNNLLIQHFTSYYGEKNRERESNQVMSDVDDDVKKALDMGARLIKGLERTYCVKIGKNAADFFDHRNVVYYSNSQYPSNISFFSDRVSSLRPNDVDVPFWMLYRGLDEKTHFKIRFWLNNSVPLFSPEKAQSDILDNDWQKNEKYKYRHIFNYYKSDFFANLSRNPFFKDLMKWIKDSSKKDNPQLEIPFNDFNAENYLILLMLKEALGNFNFEVFYDDISFTKLNSGKRYLLTLECIKHIYTDDAQTMLIIDEPENSLHLSIQEQIAENENRTIIATHSPAYAMSIMTKYPKAFELHILVKDDERKLREDVVEDDYLNNISLDSIAAEFFAYCPFLERWNEQSLDQSGEGSISIEDALRVLGLK